MSARAAILRERWRRIIAPRVLASTCCSAFVFALIPNSIGFQDLGALLARQPAVAQRWHEHLIASPFGTIHAATFSMPSPIGTAIPHPPLYALANFDPLNIARSIGAEPLGDPRAALQFPKVNRKDKRDSALSRPRAPLPPLPPLLAIHTAPEQNADAALKQDTQNSRFDRYSDYEFAAAPDAQTAASDIALPYADIPPTHLASLVTRTDPGKAAARVFFGAHPLNSVEEQIAPWAPGEAPEISMPPGSGDPDIKLSALNPPETSSQRSEGQSTANKGVVTGAEQRPKSPAERLALAGAKRAKAEKCLANAVYFEARGEPVRGQIAVAQVVMNRVFSPFYPKNICDVVYQNANRHNACQFTFACDGIPDIVTEPEAWERAKRIARDVLDGKLWVPEIAKSTHYHAYWVHPDWVAEMKKMSKLGVHMFYRPRAWGDGADEPVWGDATSTAEETKKINRL